MTDIKYTDLQLRFLELLFDDERKLTPRQAANEAGYSKGTSITQVMESVKDEILKRVDTFLALNAPSSVFKVAEVMHNPIMPGAKNALAAAQILLDRAGLVKKEKVEVQHTVPNGILILPAKEQ